MDGKLLKAYDIMASWTVAALAEIACLSRTTFAERFTEALNLSPIQYLTQWRMMLAANLLCRSNAPLAHIAEEVGYQTDTAFIRAFRRWQGVSPTEFRRSA